MTGVPACFQDGRELRLLPAWNPWRRAPASAWRRATRATLATVRGRNQAWLCENSTSGRATSQGDCRCR